MRYKTTKSISNVAPNVSIIVHSYVLCQLSSGVLGLLIFSILTQLLCTESPTKRGHHADWFSDTVDLTTFKKICKVKTAKRNR